MPILIFWCYFFAMLASPPPIKRATHLRLVEKKIYV